MLSFLQLVIGLLLIGLIVPQTTTDNIVLRKFVETGLFTNYGEAKTVLIFLTWFLIAVFLILTFSLNFFS